MSKDIEEQSPTYPSVGVNVTPDGVTLIVAMAPGFTFSQAIDEKSMNMITAKWLETRKEAKNRLQIVRDIESSKLRGLK